MANDQTEITRITFTIEPEITHCEVWFNSTNPALTGNYRKKSFPATQSIVDFMKNESHNYLLW